MRCLCSNFIMRQSCFCCLNGAPTRARGNAPGSRSPSSSSPEAAAQRLDMLILGARFREGPNGEKRPSPAEHISRPPFQGSRILVDCNSGSIVAIDSHAPSIEGLKAAVAERGLSQRIDAIVGTIASPGPYVTGSPRSLKCTPLLRRCLCVFSITPPARVGRHLAGFSVDPRRRARDDEERPVAEATGSQWSKRRLCLTGVDRKTTARPRKQGE